jgi:subtilisin family serine protease
MPMNIFIKNQIKLFLNLFFLGSLIVAFSQAAHAESSTINPQANAVDSNKQQDRYIVILDNSSDVSALADEYSIHIEHRYKQVFYGFAGSFTQFVFSKLKKDKRVLKIVSDQIVKASNFTQTGVDWGLDRIDQRSSSLNSTYEYNATGQGVNVYIIDTGIRTDHNEFEGRASIGFDALKDGRNGEDCNGHGTHVAGIVGGKTYGVAKKVNLIAIRVLDCNGSGYTSDVLMGLDWIARNRTLPAVANLSLGGGANSTLDEGVRKIISLGVATSIAAGNNNDDACLTSPARLPEAMTIGSSNILDNKATSSNFGSCVDWFAPGDSIKSAWYTTSSATKIISGTSMASPHVAGVAALYLETHPDKSPLDVRDALFSFTTKNIVKNSKTLNNHLLYSLVNAEENQWKAELVESIPAQETIKVKVVTELSRVNQLGALYVAAFYNNNWYFWSPNQQSRWVGIVGLPATGYPEVGAGNAPESFEVQVTDIYQSAHGAIIYIGVGYGADAVSRTNEMLSAQRYNAVYTIP